MYENNFINRLAYLRMQKNVSARKMSLSIGQNEGYISKIENNYSYPTIQSFLHICEYLGITPMEFFNYENQCPQISKELINEIRKLDYKQTHFLLEFIKTFKRR